MRRLLWIAATLATLGFDARANDGVDSLKSRALASAATGSVSASMAQAPFTQAHDPLPEMILRDEQERRVSQGTCQHSAKDLCYDLTDRRIVYRPIRQYMPTVEGLTPESVSLRHDRVIFKYSFR
jgi:hypothetical protein